MEKYFELAKKWEELAKEDLKMAELAEVNGLYLQSMFHSQQAIEKTIKGLIILILKKDPPYSHDLVRLIRDLNGEFNYGDSIEKQFSELNPFYISARYPSYRVTLSKGLSKVKVVKYLNLTKEVLSWLEQKLKS
ncbi:MAG TPA: HEPN domain-containing protein [Pseudobdellovibrionaceae bacterium]|nr:HEPN domain-containing protein [Pseudobdellovibrionaceae bacterium]